MVKKWSKNGQICADVFYEWTPILKELYLHMNPKQKLCPSNAGNEYRENNTNSTLNNIVDTFKRLPEGKKFSRNLVSRIFALVAKLNSATKLTSRHTSKLIIRIS